MAATATPAGGAGGGAAMTLKVGTKVLVKGTKSGTVAYIGTVDFAAGEFCGIKLDKPAGKNNGTVDGRTYFKCKANHGLFVRPDQCRPFSKEDQAAAVIESGVRRHQAEQKVNAEINWRMYNTLDNDDEHQHIEKVSKLRAAGLDSGSAADLLELRDGRDAGAKRLDAEVVEADYYGAHLKWPLELDNVMEMLDHFKHGRSLHYKYTMQLLLEFRRRASALPTLVKTTVPAGCKLTVVGDLHGQLQDLFSIFTINDVPAEDNHYLFNGDFVDRGKAGVEIVLTIMAFHILYPEAVFFNRGNHEERSQNETAGFMGEVLGKYRSKEDRLRGKRVYDLFEACFDACPLAHVIEDKIFVVHGGLFDRKGIKLAHIQAVHRKRPIPLVRDTFEDGVFQDMMWSDPRAIKGTVRNDRGAGVFFGPDITHSFCKQNELELIVRSHECVPQGYKFHHGNRVLTLFSASRYMGTYTNKGAILVIKPGLKKNLQQFVAHSMGAVELRTAAEREKAQEAEVLAMVIERIVEHKHELLFYYSNEDTARSGTISRLQWAEGMQSVLKLDLPWLRLCGKLCDLVDGRVQYGRFLARYRIEMRDADLTWQEGIVETICEQLYRKAGTIESAYKYFDVNDDGKIEYEEFMMGLKRLDVGLTDPQMYDLMASIDVDKDSHIQFSEFADRFKPVFTRVKDDLTSKTPGRVLKRPMSLASLAKSDLLEKGARADMLAGVPEEGESTVKVDGWTQEALRRIGGVLIRKYENPRLVFASFDSSGDGLISGAEFAAGIKGLGLDYSEADIKRLLGVLDTNKSGHINYLEFIAAFKVADVNIARGKARAEGKEVEDGADEGLGGWQQEVIDGVINVLYRYRIELAAAFSMFDTDGSGTVSREEFKRGMDALAKVMEATLTEEQVEQVVKYLDTDGDGQLNYAEFFNAFKIVDTEKGTEAEPPNPPMHTRPASMPHPPTDDGGAAGGAGTGAVVTGAPKRK